MGLQKRIAKLEDDGEGRKPCEECGHSEAAGACVGYEVSWEDDTNTVDDEPDFCPTCGRQLSYIIRWPDEEGG